MSKLKELMDGNGYKMGKPISWSRIESMTQTKMPILELGDQDDGMLVVYEGEVYPWYWDGNEWREAIKECDL